MPANRSLSAGAATAALLGLAACDAPVPGGTASRTTVDVAGRALTVAAPAGFCIDRASTAVSDAGAFVLMSDCALLGGGGAPSVGAAMTASISTGGLGGEGDDPVQSLTDLAEFVASGEGRALLGRSGQPGAVRILASQQQGDVLYVLVEDRGRQPIAGIDRRFWRAFLEVDDHMVVLSVLGFEGAGVDPQQGLDLLAGLAAAMQAANGA